MHSQIGRGRNSNNRGTRGYKLWFPLPLQDRDDSLPASEALRPVAVQAEFLVFHIMLHMPQSASFELYPLLFFQQLLVRTAQIDKL